MKKSTKLMVALLVIVATLAVTYRLMFEMSYLKPRFAVLCQYARGRKDCDGGREQGLSCF